MTVTPQTPWRATGDTTVAGLRAEFAKRPASPLIADAGAIHAAAAPYTRLLAGMSFCEQQHAAVPSMARTAWNHNFLSITDGYDDAAGHHVWMSYPSFAACAADWLAQITDPAEAYAACVTVADLCAVYVNGPGGAVPTGYPEHVCQIVNRMPLASSATGDATVSLNMTKGLIPHPKVVQKIIGYKPEGVGWDNLGKRTCKGIVLHRMQGTLQSTYDFFSLSSTAALTDFGINSKTGEIWQYNDPFGIRSGWASGTVNQPYGDGAAFVNKYGLNAVNRDQLSIETDLYFAQPGQTTREDPVSDDWRRGLAAWIAPYAHDYGIPYNVWPIAPQDGFSFIRWHQEFTIGTGKVCPGKAIMDATPALIEDVRAILKHYQEGPTVTAAEKPTETPATPVDSGIGGIPYKTLFGPSYDAKGLVSTLWRETGKRTGKWPELTSRNDKNTTFVFTDGSVITVANGKASYLAGTP